MARDSLDELFGDADLEDFLGDELEVGNIFKSIGKAVGGAVKAVTKVPKAAVKAVKKVAKPLAKAAKAVVGSKVTKAVFPVAAVAASKPGQAIAAKYVPGGKTLTDAQAKLTKAVNKAAKGSSAKAAKSKSSSKAKPLIKLPSLSAKKSVPTQKAVTARTAAQTALAAPVPMPAMGGSVVPTINIVVQPYRPASSPVSAAKPPNVDELSAKIEAKLGPQMRVISDTLKTFSLQNQATSEHKALEEKGDFQRKVISSLKRIAAKKSA
jgi:hypothetical protein